MAQTFGSVVLALDDSRFLIDAKPHVMQRVRLLFEGAKTWPEPGTHTHAPVTIPTTMMVARDLSWFLERYPMVANERTMAAVHRGAARYDHVIEASAAAQTDDSFSVTPGWLEMALQPRTHQKVFRNMIRRGAGRMLLADEMGMGKSVSGITLLLEPEFRPALIVVPPGLRTHWETMLWNFLPKARRHVIRGRKNYKLPDVDAVIVSYNLLSDWEYTLCDPKRHWPTVIFDEVQELRHLETGKRKAAIPLSKQATVSVGMSGTPFYNMGAEMWGIIDLVSPGALGERGDFVREWCVGGGQVREPETLNSYLTSQGLMLRREPKDAGLDFGGLSKHVITIDADLEQLRDSRNILRTLALSVMSGSVRKIGSSLESARELDWRLRHLTGVSKAKPVAELVKNILDEREKVLLLGWHHDVYEIWRKELARFNPVSFMGEDTEVQKQKNLKRFIEGDARILMMSLRSGAGLDGLQHVCWTAVVGELDWSPHVLDQLIARLRRDGQRHHVDAYYPIVNDGSDPPMTETLGIKRSQHEGIVEGHRADAEKMNVQVEGSNFSRVREMAAAYLRSIGEEVPERKATGLLAVLADELRGIRITANDEKEMQDALWKVLPGLIPDTVVEREVKISKKSRLDFRVSRGDERVAIECKIDSSARADVYRQVRRYASEAGVTSVLLYAPWGGVPSFDVDGIQVEVVDPSRTQV